MKRLFHITTCRQISDGLGRFLFLITFILCSVGLRGEDPARRPTTPVFDEELSGYKKTEPTGAVALLQQRLKRGEAKLTSDARHGYLNSLLRELGLPPSSQALVFSKTSPLRHYISPQNPRALYFDDRVAVAYVPSAPDIEIAAQDPKLGVVFYTLEQKESAQPQLRRDDRCLECHASSKSLEVPGLLVRSFVTSVDGEVDLLSGTMVNHRTPLAERWGGYYVTGTHGDQAHLGNLFGPDAIKRHEKEPSYHGNLTDLKGFLDLSKYPAPGSDIVALMVLEHQVHMVNLLTRLNYEATKSLRETGNTQSANSAAEAVLKYLLFVEEARIRAPIQGTADFAAWFQQQGPADSQGRSLRQFDLKTRLFKFPCSYMIYSPTFDSLPSAAKKHLYRRLWDILSDEKEAGEFARLSVETKRAIKEILSATKPDLPVYWRL